MMKPATMFPFLLLLLACAIVPAYAQVDADSANDEAAIRALQEQLRLGVLNRDSEALGRLWSEDFMVNSPFNQVAPNAAVVLDLMRQGLIHYTSFEVRIEHIRIDDDIAIVMGGETVQPTGSAPLAGQTVQRRFTHVWRRDDGEWRLIARHANNVIPAPSE